MKKYPVTNNIIDCFWGDGWEHWARVKVQSGKKPTVIGQSERLPKDFWRLFGG